MPVTWGGNWRASLCASCGRAWAPWAAWARCSGPHRCRASKQFGRAQPVSVALSDQSRSISQPAATTAHPGGGLRDAGASRAPSVVPKLFICATNVRTGGGKIFKGEQVTADAIMASACLPQLFKAVEIDGECYWDGGFSGNPALYPLIYETGAGISLLVQINPKSPMSRPTRPARSWIA